MKEVLPMSIRKTIPYKAGLGQSVIEIIVAVSIFVLISGGSVITILGSFLASRLAEEETTASFYAVEGLEAVKSIRNQSWNNLKTADGNHGLDNTSGSWTFSGSADILGKYTRVINVSSLVDPDSKEITATVTWSFIPTKLTIVEMTTQLANWQEVSFEALATTPTPILTPTPTVSPTLTPTPSITTCTAYCSSLGYSQGTCRRNVNQCNSNGETNEPGGNQYCTSGPNTTCCCA